MVHVEKRIESSVARASNQRGAGRVLLNFNILRLCYGSNCVLHATRNFPVIAILQTNRNWKKPKMPKWWMQL